MTQEWGPNWYHFTVEHLPRIMVFLDVLLENEDIKIAVHNHGHDKWHDTRKEYEAHLELLGLLGIARERVILVDDEVSVSGAFAGLDRARSNDDPVVQAGLFVLGMLHYLEASS